MGLRHPVPSTATHCNTLKCPALYCDILQHAATTHRRRSCSLMNDATHYNALQCTTMHYTALQHTATHYSKLQQLAGAGLANGKHRNAPQHSATYCNTVYCRTQCTATTCGRRSRSLINDATHYNALQHTTLHCNIRQHTTANCNNTATTCGRRSRSLINDSRRAQSPIWKSCCVCIVCYVELQ